MFASPKSRLVAQMLAFLLGVFGAHRFYVGKTGTGILQLCTFGGLGIWWMYDNIMILSGSFRDRDDLLVSDWGPETDRLVSGSTAGAMFDELDQLRGDVTDLQERLDFAERLLADPGRQDTPPR